MYAPNVGALSPFLYCFVQFAIMPSRVDLKIGSENSPFWLFRSLFLFYLALLFINANQMFGQFINMSVVNMLSVLIFFTLISLFWI